MSTNDRVTCSGVTDKSSAAADTASVQSDDVFKKKEYKQRKVCFPEEHQLVTKYFEPSNPWQDIPTTTRSQLAAEYLESCRKHRTPPIDSVLQQIRELPDNTIGGGVRSARLTLSQCSLLGPRPIDALEALMRKVQFRRLELDHADIDDEGAEALFDMIEFYESTSAICLMGPQRFGIRGWQAASRMIKKSVELTELEVCDSPLESSHAPVLERALRPASCRLRVLCLQQAALAGEPLLCLVIALKTNTSIRELRLGDNRLTPSDAQQIASVLRYNTRLQLLDLSNNLIQDSGVEYISSALVEQAEHSPPSAVASPLSPHSACGYESTGLAFLVLWNNQLTRNCAQNLAKVLRTSKSLCVLNVGRNPLGSEAVRSLVGRGLVSLGLQAARLGPDAARGLADIIRGGERLQRLDLRDNKLGVPGLQAILAAVKEHASITQIDLDDPAESQTGVQSTEAATVARLLREIRVVCRGNEPAAPDRLMRKISLTCHTVPMIKTPAADDDRRVRLRSPAPSPAPSPAGSPVPTPTGSRFSVTRVTPEREMSDSTPTTPTTPTRCTSSRFKVVQVVEPQVVMPRKSVSRFSVTRNYDSTYNPTLPPTTPSPSPSPSPTPSPVPDRSEKIGPTPLKKVGPTIDGSGAKVGHIDKQAANERSNIEHTQSVDFKKTNTDNKETTNKKETEMLADFSYDEVRIKDVILKDKDKDVKDIEGSLIIIDDVRDEDEEPSSEAAKDLDVCDVLVTSDFGVKRQVSDDSVHDSDNDVFSDSGDFKNLDLVYSDTYNGDRNEQMSHSETVGGGIETGVARCIGVSETDRDMTIETDNSLTKVHRDQNVNNIYKDDKVAIEDDGKGVDVVDLNVTVVPARDSVVLKKNKSESSLDSPDLEVSRLMRRPVSAFCDSSSSLEISGSSMESLNTDRPRLIIDKHLSKDNSVESTSEVTPVNLNVSISSNESVSPIIFAKKIHGSLSSLEASVSSVESAKEKIMVTSADSGIEYSLQNPSEMKDDSSSNEGTLTNCSSSLKETMRKDSQDTVTPKRTSSLLDVPALKSKGLERMRKISWVAPSASFHLPKADEKVEYKLPGNLEKLLSLFQHPSSLFSRSSSDDERKSNSGTPPRKDSSLTSSFWSWGSVAEKNDDDSISDATDSTLSERVQVSFVDESFSKKLDSKTPSTDTDNTLSEFQFPNTEKVTVTTDKLVQSLDVSDSCSANPSDDLIVPNDFVYDDNLKSEDKVDVKRTFASVLKSSGSENSLERPNPDVGQTVEKLPSKVIKGIKENISPENTLTSSIATKAMAMEVAERQAKNKQIVNTVWEVTNPLTEKSDTKVTEKKTQSDLAPIANIDETCDVSADDVIQLAYIDDKEDGADKVEKVLENIDLGKDALSYLIYENQDYEADTETVLANRSQEGSLAQELRDAEIKEMLDLSPELVLDEALEIPEIFTVEIKGRKSSPVIPERAKMKKSNSLEDLTKRQNLEEKESPKMKTIAFKVPESTTPRDIPERRTKLRSRSGSSPKSLPESLNKPCPLTKMDSILSKKKKKVSSLGKMAKDSLLALNMSEEEIAEFRRSYKLTSVESLRSLESVSEDANSHSGTSYDSRCRACLRTSQESLMSLDSINEDCRCADDEKRHHR
ncbi:uncharacterized protein LOC116778420 [Danaus plexippus]|nr:uncharacterized protein LOC116778420 [Danaus plexippus]